jgi:para-nitrobenzyl esterase
VINQSGSRMVVTTIEAARATGGRFATAVGCTDNVAACLRTLPVATILAKQRGFLPGVMVDGTVLPAQPGASILAGNIARVPLLSGFTGREQAFALAAREMSQGPLKAEGYATDIAVFASSLHKDEILAAYPLGNYASPSEADIAAIQHSKGCISRWLATANGKWASTYAYEFDDQTAPSYFPPMSFPMGAYHTSDIQYLFPLFKGGLGSAHPLNQAQQKVADEMLDYWANFARNGDPNGPGLRRWERYDPDADTMIGLGSGTLLSGYAVRNRCDFWDKVNVY